MVYNRSVVIYWIRIMSWWIIMIDYVNRYYSWVINYRDYNKNKQN
jgi:hypothetical protein